MILRKLTFCLLILLSFTSVYAQNAGIKGIITDQLNGSPLEYASVSLYRSSDSSLITGTVTSAGGTFELNKLKAGNYYIKAHFIGYQTKVTSNIRLSSNQKIDLKTIALSADQRLLSEITVMGQRASAYNKIDKQVYTAEQFESAKGGSAIDVLKNMPSISVNGQGDITMRGSTGFLVLLNGKPVLTDPQTVLSQLPANAVDNIELITAPSAKYDPDGKSGIINIITKKGAADGFTFTANVQGGLPSTTDHGNAEKPVRFGGDAALNYQKGKWDISVGGNYTRNDVAGYRAGDVFTKDFDNSTITRFPSNGERSFDKYNYAGRASIGFQADKNNAFSLGFFSGKRYQARIADILYHNTTSDLSTDALIKSTTYFNANTQTKQGNFTLGNLDYTHTFENKSSLTLSALFERADLYGNTKNRNLDYPNISDTIQYVYNPHKNPINGYRLKLDYAVPIGQGKLESGYQFRYDTQDGRFGYVITPSVPQPEEERFSGEAKAKNQINSVYSQYSGKADRLEYTAGLRYEYASRTVNLSYEPIPHELNLSNLFPSANILYSMSNAWKLKAGYSKRVQRTSNYELNPIPEREHSETLEQGDPELLPEFIDLAELGLIKTFNQGSFFTTLYFQNIKNPIQRVNSVYADTILNRVFTNAEKARSFGLEAGTNLQPAKWWNLYLGANVYNYKINGKLNILDESLQVSNADWVYSINMNTNFQLSSSWSVQGNVNYLSNRPTAQGEDSRFLSPNTSVKKTFMNGRMSAMLQWQNMDLGIFGSNQQRISTWGNDFYTTTNYIYETDVFMVNLSFNLNQRNKKAKLPVSEFGEKEF